MKRYFMQIITCCLFLKYIFVFLFPHEVTSYMQQYRVERFRLTLRFFDDVSTAS